MENNLPFQELENNLHAVLKTIAPDQDFVDKLRHKFTSKSEIFLERKPINGVLVLFLSVFALSVLFFWFFRQRSVKR